MAADNSDVHGVPPAPVSSSFSTWSAIVRSRSEDIGRASAQKSQRTKGNRGVGQRVAHSPWSTARRGRDHEVRPHRPGAAHINGAALLKARREKELKYHELVAGNRCALVVVAVETGGRWSSEAVYFVSALAGARRHGVHLRCFAGLRSWLGVAVGRGCSQCLVAGRLPPAPV